MLPELWAAAPEEERLALVTFLQAQAERTWTKAHTSEAFTQGNRLSEIQLGPELILVEQIVKSSTDAKENGFLYWFRLDEGQWKIVDRTQRIDGRHREPSGLVRVLRNRISSQIGRPPTLGEFVANAPSWLPRIRIRSLAVE
jgi:hypothetical protein